MAAMNRSIVGKVAFENLGPGCWGIIESSGQIWRIINMPEQLKYPGRQVEVRIKPVEEGASIFMWGSPAKLIAFSTFR